MHSESISFQTADRQQADSRQTADSRQAADSSRMVLGLPSQQTRWLAVYFPVSWLTQFGHGLVTTVVGPTQVTTAGRLVW